MLSGNFPARFDTTLGPQVTVIVEDDIQTLRREVAAAGRALVAKTLSYDEFMQRFAGYDDELIADLVDLIEHEPPRRGFFGSGEKHWAQYQSQIAAALAALES